MGHDGAEADGQRLRAVAITPDPLIIDNASEGFDRRFRRRSARYVFSFAQSLILTGMIAGGAWAAHAFPDASWSIAHAAVFALFAAAILWRLFAAASLAPVRSKLFSPGRGESWPTYSLLCPLHREADVVFDLVAALDKLDYPRDALDIQLLVEADDPDTITAALAAASGDHIEVVIAPKRAPRTKPKALNIGLARARGEFLAVFDAEDRPHPAQLRAAVAAFRAGGEALACVQAPLVIDNAAASWIARQFAAEYAIQFGEVLPLLARLRLPLPLGGTSNHFRTAALRQCGGWDPYNVTEDADLGYRLARHGCSMDVIAPPTWEEAPVTLSAWLKQRTRWIKGHVQTWLVLMRDPLGSAREMGWRAFLSMHLVLGGGVLASLLHAPLALALAYTLLAHVDLLGPADFILALCGYVVAVFAALTASALSGDLSHARAAPTMPFYWPLATLSATWALLDLVVRPHYWAKTRHGVSPRARFPFRRTLQSVRLSNSQNASTSASA
ncbi:MAG TPA: glycosyltransferase [Caulobacterales bacterium]|nr:glycosyltransferase [Caulobacterales bacterium]